MSTGMGNVSFRGEEKQQSSSTPISPLVLGTTGAIGGGVTGYVLGEKMPAMKVAELNSDRFQRTFEKIPEDKKPIVGRLAELKEELAPEKIAVRVNNYVSNLMKKSETITVPEFLEKTPYKTVEGLEEAAKGLDEKAAQLTKAHEAAVKVFEEADEAGKEPARQAVDAAKAEIDKFLAHADEVNRTKEVVEAAKEGVISKAVITEHATSGATSGIAKKITTELEALGKDAPKVNSLKRGGIYGLFAATAGVATAILLGVGKKDNTENT